MLLLVLIAGCAAEQKEAPPASAGGQPAGGQWEHAWARDALWDDGRAEVALYDAKRPQYGKTEEYQAVFIVVKEDFNRQQYVKADPPYDGKDLLPVLKLNAVHSYWTDRYPYHYLESVFVRRDDPTALVKLTLGGQEWCGNTFKEITTWGGPPRLVFHSYFDGQGDGSSALDLRPGDLLEDQLPLALRSLKFQPGLSFQCRLLPSLISNSVRGPLAPAEASIKVTAEEMLSSPATGRAAAWKVEVRWGEVQQAWWFEKAAPHGLLKMESSDGRSWLLRERTRKAYWREPTFRPEM